MVWPRSRSESAARQRKSACTLIASLTAPARNRIAVALTIRWSPTSSCRVGLARPDPLFLGVDVNENGALIEYRSRPSRLLLPLDQRVKAVFGKPPLCLRFGSRPSNWPYTWPKPCALKNDPMICWKLPPVDTQAREVAAPGSGLSSSADRRSSLIPTWLAAPDSVTL
jgi:hypothetical protein